jgi:hypothetical protein
MSGDIKPIETEYNGYKFRSRQEARWAVFFDSLGIEYWYEHEGYELSINGDSVFYLPDFYLPRLDCFIEVKGEKPVYEETEKAYGLTEATGKKVYILWGKVDCPDNVRSGSNDGHYVYHEPFGWDYAHFWCECPTCGFIGIEHGGWADRLTCDCVIHGRTPNHNSPRLLEAYKKAKQARFEFGHSGTA